MFSLDYVRDTEIFGVKPGNSKIKIKFEKLNSFTTEADII